MSGHTPGPWRVVDGVRVYTNLGADSGDGARADCNDGWCIADVSEVAATSHNRQATHLGFAVMRANARLIASAPELLFALRALLRRAKDELADPQDVHEVAIAEDVIARATGAAP